MKSLECGYWVPEDPYEMSREFPSARFFRLDRQQSVSSHQPSLFKGCGSVFIANGSLPPATQLERLLTLGGGKCVCVCVCVCVCACALLFNVQHSISLLR